MYLQKLITREEITDFGFKRKKKSLFVEFLFLLVIEASRNSSKNVTLGIDNKY